MRELIDNKRLRRLWWVDTRDMISDGLNKGSIDRKAIINVLQHNVWAQTGDSPCALTCFTSLPIASKQGKISYYYNSISCSYIARRDDIILYEQNGESIKILATCSLQSLTSSIC